MAFMLNDKEYKSDELTLKDEIVYEEQNLKVVENKIKIQPIKLPEGSEQLNVVSISRIKITPLDVIPPLSSGKKSVGANTFVGKDCLTNPEDCVFDAIYLNQIQCPGKLVMVSGMADKEMACKYKCVKSKYDTKEDCNKTCPDGSECKVLKEGGYNCATA